MPRATPALPAAAAAVLLLFAIVALPCPASSSSEDCTTHAARQRDMPHTARVRLVWQSAPARAAAALLRAALLVAGYEPANIELSYADDDVCALLANHASTPADQMALVAVAVPQSEAWCSWDRKSLQVMGRGVAPVTPRLHARLAQPWRDQRACSADTMRDRDLHHCGFLPLGTGGVKEKNTTVYTLNGEWKNETKILCSRLHCEALSRTELADRVKNANYSFLFFDAELWRYASGVRLLDAPEHAALSNSLLIADVLELLKHAPALYLLLDEGTFTPNVTDLLAVLKGFDQHACAECAACSHAPQAADYNKWMESLKSIIWRRVVAVVCKTEKAEDYNLIENITITIDHSHSSAKMKLYTQILYVNCSDPSKLAVEMKRWHVSYLVWRTWGVAAPAELASMAAHEAEISHLPLLAYTPAPAVGVRSVTGTPKQLALALRRLLTACKWNRLGLVSDSTPLASAVKAALVDQPGLLTHEVRAETPDESIRDLLSRNTRVFFVNSDSAAAARVLHAAASILTRHDQHVWIVRDYEAPDTATAELKPLSVTFQWRGENPPPARSPFLFPRDWQNRTWPRHAASLLDALITLKVGADRLISNHKESLDYPDMEDKLRYFWTGVQNDSIAGVVHDLKYDESGVVRARVYVERWNNSKDMRPHLVTVWSTDDLPPAGEECPVADLQGNDGSVSCLIPAGDLFDSRCHDALACGGIAAGAAALAALGLAAVASRRWLARRDRRIQRDTTARVLAQREATFAELAPYLVERAALALGEELGVGRYGRVRRGEVHAARRRPAAVAVKTLREGASPAEESQFLREARLLATLEHKHVVRFQGVCWEEGPPLLLMELALFGDLLRYLRARRHLAEGAEFEGAADGAARAGPEEAAAVSAEALTRLAREAAEALAYLASRGLVHRDVRAANCLVDARRSLKLADFGLARETGPSDGEYTCRGRALFPVLWMAPESLARGVATAASDAWSFGVLALELVTMGARPFGGAAPEAAVRAVLAGGRPPLPRDACAETRALAVACWRREPGARPAAARLAAWLARRRTALRPALAPDLEEPECDSGIGEPDPHIYRDPCKPSPDTRRLIPLDSIT